MWRLVWAVILVAALPAERVEACGCRLETSPFEYPRHGNVDVPLNTLIVGYDVGPGYVLRTSDHTVALVTAAALMEGALRPPFPSFRPERELEPETEYELVDPAMDVPGLRFTTGRERLARPASPGLALIDTHAFITVPPTLCDPPGSQSHWATFEATPPNGVDAVAFAIAGGPEVDRVEELKGLVFGYRVPGETAPISRALGDGFCGNGWPGLTGLEHAHMVAAAVDRAGNVSAWSEAVEVVMPATVPTPGCHQAPTTSLAGLWALLALTCARARRGSGQDPKVNPCSPSTTPTSSPAG